MELKKSYYCEKCNRVLDEKEFYTSNDLEKYPDGGKLKMCKKCITMHVDNWDPNTYTWILKEIDVPYVPDEWNKLLAKYGQDPSKVTGLTIIGRYLSKMKLKQWKDYRWKDNEFLQELANHRIKEAMTRSGFGAAEITQAIERNTIEMPTGEMPPEPEPEVAPPDFYDASPPEDEDNEIEMSLTDEDKTYLKLKWGKNYRPDEWVWLEKLYNEMCDSYDIHSAGHIDTLKLVCKTSLKANKLLDVGDQ